jgi:hypothetical protein
MKKNYSIFKHGLMGALVLSAALKGVADDEHFTMQSVQLVEKRYYLIKRLEGPMATLFLAHKYFSSKPEKRIFKESLDRIFDCDQFRHPLVRASAQAVQQHQTLEPCRKIWRDFLSYRHLEDQSFVRETITLVLMLYNNLLQHLKFGRDTLFVSKPKSITKTWTDWIFGNNEHTRGANVQDYDLIHALVAGDYTSSSVCPDAECETVQDNFKAIAGLLDESEHHDMVLNNIMRFYHMQRLTKPMYLFSALSAKRGTAINLHTVSIPAIFKHELIIQCIEQMKQSGTLQPFFKLWKRLATYDFIEDRVLLQEFVRLMIILYEQLIVSTRESVDNDARIASQATVGDMMQMYEKISTLPIADLLTLLDEMSDRYEYIVQEYEFSNKTLSWSDWLKKYWWAPPVIIVSFALVVLRHSKSLQKLVHNVGL